MSTKKQRFLKSSEYLNGPIRERGNVREHTPAGADLAAKIRRESAKNRVFVQHSARQFGLVVVWEQHAADKAATIDRLRRKLAEKRAAAEARPPSH